MFAPAPVAALSLSWAYVTATLTAMPLFRSGQNLGAALCAVLIAIELPIVPEATIPAFHILQ